MLAFEWDENKNRANQSKHKISFEEAQTVFYDERALVIDDPEHSEEEERFRKQQRRNLPGILTEVKEYEEGI